MDLDEFEDLPGDKASHEKWELLGGRVVKTMVGARWEHHCITRNLAVFPDVMARCGGPLEPGATSIGNPAALAETVSPGTENRDRKEKWDLYRRLPSRQHYPLIERDAAMVVVMGRAGERDWTTRRVEGLDAETGLPPIGVTVPMRELYRDVCP